MATPFSDVYSQFLQKITDSNLAKLIISDPAVADNRMMGWLKSAIPKFSKCKVSLADRDETNKVFNQNLSDSEKEILSRLMVVEWLEPEVKNILEMKNHFSTKDFSIHSTSNLLKEKRDLLNDEIEKTDRLIVEYTFDTADFSKLG